jgi:uncharacterized protein (UPF0335 family)
MSANARERLVHLVQNLERLEAAKQAAGEALRDAFSGAKRAGYDPSTLKAVLRLRKLTPEQREERRALEAIYLAALGMLEGDSLPDAARRRLDEQDSAPPKPERSSGPQAKEAKPPKPAEAPAPPPPPQMQMNLKDPKEARQEGRDAAAAGKRIYDNPFPAGDPCRAAWDEGWCAQQKSHGMDTPAAYQRRSKPDQTDKASGAGEKKGAA